MEDLPELLQDFLDSFARQYQVPLPTLTDDAMALLTSYKWPGNVRELKNVAERLVIRCRNSVIDVTDLPMSVRRTEPALSTAGPPARGNLDRLYDRMVVAKESFWAVVYAPFMSRDLTRDDLRALVRKGLEQTGGNYRVLTELFNMSAGDYKRFLSFLRKHHCHVAFQQFRTVPGRPLGMTSEQLDREKKPRSASA